MKRHENNKKKGVFRKRNPPYPQELPKGMRGELIALGEKIHSLTKNRQYDEAARLCQDGLESIPKPQDAYVETIWYLTALGDIYFAKEMYSLARECYDKAQSNLSGEGKNDSFIMLRLGEIALETGDEEAALRYLLSVYKAEGSEIFEDYSSDPINGAKYYDFLRSHTDLNGNKQ